MKRNLLSLALTAMFVLGLAVVIWAKVPPPPVNQTLGIYDTKFGDLTTPDCKVCHTGTDTQLAEMHHALINTVTPPAAVSGRPISPPTSLTVAT